MNEPRQKMSGGGQKHGVGRMCAVMSLIMYASARSTGVSTPYDTLSAVSQNRRAQCHPLAREPVLPRPPRPLSSRSAVGNLRGCSSLDPWW